MCKGDFCGRGAVAIWIMSAVSMALFAGMLFCGSVEIGVGEVWGAVLRSLGGRSGDGMSDLIVVGVRMPMALTAFLAGMGLSVSGLLLQTTFNNPLAGPSILGISTGASLGVAVVMLAFG